MLERLVTCMFPKFRSYWEWTYFILNSFSLLQFSRCDFVRYRELKECKFLSDHSPPLMSNLLRQRDILWERIILDRGWHNFAGIGLGNAVETKITCLERHIRLRPAINDPILYSASYSIFHPYYNKSQ
jgi:hypothetical protein